MTCLVVLHYHLNRGGVTSVIVNQLRSLAEIGADIDRCYIFYGGRREAWRDEDVPSAWRSRVKLEVIEHLEYDSEQAGCSPHGEQLLAALQKRLATLRADSGSTLLHVHNHGLGKNAALPAVLGRLALAGYPLLLQIHDFAEDFRPENYRHLLGAYASAEALQDALYPHASQIHYAVLNGRDHQLMMASGCPAERLHLLPNPVAAPGGSDYESSTRSAARRQLQLGGTPFVVYPVRGIRRKNVGELLLWSAALEGQAVFAVTLPPLNPVELAPYERWQKLAQSLNLSCRFSVGSSSGLSFEEILAAADRLITTSVAEGFGMVFLESWLAGKALIGRNLPEITADFVRAGLSYPDLHDRLLVPLDWFGIEQLLDELVPVYAASLEAYGKTLPSRSEMREALERQLSRGGVDFASLPVKLQRRAVRLVASEEAQRRAFLDQNPWMTAAACQPSPLEDVQRNAALVAQHFSFASCGQRLWNAYQAAAGSPRCLRLDPAARSSVVLDAFLQLSRFRPVRTES